MAVRINLRKQPINKLRNIFVIFICRMTESVKVMVRVRPMNSKELERGCQSLVTVNRSTHQIGLKKLTANPTVKYFAYDHVFPEDSSQQQVYEQSAFELVENVLNGYNGTIFAYGQTGCGKTHTMLGVTTTTSTKKAQMITQAKSNLPVTVTSLKLEENTMGIIPRAFNQIMTVTNSQQEKKHLIQCTFIEIYNEEIHDLLGKDIKAKLTLQEAKDGLAMKDLSVHLAKNVPDMVKLMEIGYKNRVIRETNMNKESSRSHCIFTIRIEESLYDQNGVQKFKVGKLNLVDLAGSQRQSKTNLKDDGVKEAAKINLSLSALGNVISALADGKNQHIPYRDSKLTRILHDSLGGNTKTVMIATISPSDFNYEETLSTLRYSSRAKYIQNKPVINEDPKDALLRKYEEQIRRLKMILEGKLPYVKGNDTFYLKNEDGQHNIFNKFPELRNEENEAILNKIESTEQSLRERSAENNQEEKNFLETELQTTKKVLDSEKEEKENLKRQLTFLQEIMKKEINTGPQVVEELGKIAELKEKLKEQKQKEQKYKQEQKKRQQELLNIETNYKNLNEEVDTIKEKFEDIRMKYINVNEELKDSREAHAKEKDQILDALRIQEAENNKLMEILSVMVPSQELDKVLDRCSWIDDRQEWVVPKFHFNSKYGIIVPKQGEKLPDLIEKQNKAMQKLEDTAKASKVNKLNNLIVQEATKSKLKQSVSQRKISTNSADYENSRSGSVKHLKMGDEPNKSKNNFKRSFYSDDNARKLKQAREEEKKLLQKYKFSLKPLPSAKTGVTEDRKTRVSLDLDQIKNEIMSEMKENKRSFRRN